LISHSTTFEDLATAPVKQTDVRVIRQTPPDEGAIISYVDDPTVTWTSSDILMSVQIDVVGVLLGTATKKAVVKLLGTTSAPKVDEVFRVELGLYDTVAAGFEYISEGYYIVDSVDVNYDADSTTITLYDFMWLAKNTLYSQSSGLTFPATLESMAAQIAETLGVTLMADFNLLPNSDHIEPADPYTTIAGATLQSIIGEIAGATGTTARITDTTLVFTQFETLSENLNSDSLKQLKIGKKYGPVTSVILGRVPQNDNIVIAGSTPADRTISSINATTNLFTITAHGMTDGNIVQVESTSTLPAPLLPQTNYYVYTNGSVNTFALAPTYLDAIAGTNLVDLTTVGTGTITLSDLARQEIQINNNEILDDDRQALLPPLYQVLSGIEWSQVNAETVGLGWHELGDVIQFTQGSTVASAFINEIHLVLEGSVKETLVSSVPDVAQIDYSTAGGIMKTLWNTEIRVDKQDNTITSVVARQDTLDNTINENFTQITQDVDDVTLTVQKAGGGNLLLNSVGYAKEQTPDALGANYAKLLSWDYLGATGTTYVPYEVATHGTVTSYDSSESQNYGGISGRVIQMSSSNYLASPAKVVRITQRVNVAVGTSLSFGMRVRNDLGKGDALVILSNDNDTFYAYIDDIANNVWVEVSKTDFVTTMPWLDIAIETNAEKFMFTDLRLLYGTTLRGWVQSNNEILASNVQFTIDGMRVFDDVHDTETRVTYNRFSTVRRTDNEILFEADDTGVITNDLKIKGSTSYVRDGTTIIKQITIPADNAKAGIAFIKAA